MTGAKPRTVVQKRYRVGHVLFRTTEHPRHGVTFALFPDVEGAEKKASLFSGHVQRGMGDELRRLAYHFDDLEAQLASEVDVNT